MKLNNAAAATNGINNGITTSVRKSAVKRLVSRSASASANASTKLGVALNPAIAFPRRVAAEIKFTFDPTWLLEPEHLVPAMAYPDFDDPMYEKLRDVSSELLLPNLKLIPPNSITLLETNPPFIEAYLTGINFEFGKELLWREYPTDQRGSYFRQFWDTRGIIAPPSDVSARICAPGCRCGRTRSSARPCTESSTVAGSDQARRAAAKLNADGAGITFISCALIFCASTAPTP